MKLNKIAKHLALAGVLTTLSVSAFAQIMPKEATAATQQANNALYNTLPFADKTDFDNARRRTSLKANRVTLFGTRQNTTSSKKGKKRRPPSIRACGVSRS